MPPITLTVLDGPASGETITRDAGQLRLGRGRVGNVLPLRDEGVSEKHAALSFNGDTWFASDLGSTNGTWLNESRAKMLKGQDYPLRSGDLLRLGLETVVQASFTTQANDDDTVAERLAADAERLAASVRAAAAASAARLRAQWAEQRTELLRVVED